MDWWRFTTIKRFLVTVAQPSPAQRQVDFLSGKHFHCAKWSINSHFNKLSSSLSPGTFVLNRLEVFSLALYISGDMICTHYLLRDKKSILYKHCQWSGWVMIVRRNPHRLLLALLPTLLLLTIVSFILGRDSKYNSQ